MKTTVRIYCTGYEVNTNKPSLLATHLPTALPEWQLVGEHEVDLFVSGRKLQLIADGIEQNKMTAEQQEIAQLKAKLAEYENNG